ncbi:hypothetical protein [uncultured Eubacterium sp.]|uniref:hypothetical protein n=1 Tax=uncultured Eubacterium sp. TaxID=165185 RepID=UPI0025EADE5A|nr:hypothetical protein [uncultured Eubacterium sp.]
MDRHWKNAFNAVHMSEEKKQQVFEDICDKYEKKKKHCFTKVAVAACVLAVAIPSVGFAGEKIASYMVSVKKDQMHTVFEISDSQNEENKNMAQEYVKLNVTDLTGYTRDTDAGFDEMKVIHFRSEENPNKEGLYVEILQIDCDTDQFYEKNIADAQELELNGQKAVYMKQNHLVGSQYKAGTEGKEVAVFYEDYGYALLIQGIGMESMSDNDFLLLAEKITLTPATKETADVMQSMSEYMSEIKRSESNNAVDNEDLYMFPTNKMCDLDGTQNYWGIRYHIDNLEVRDKLSGLNISGYQEEVLEKLNDGIGIDENWNLQPYERETVTFGDGYENAEQYVAQTETVAPKLVLVTMTIKNISYEDDDDMLPIANPLSYIKEVDDQLEFDWREFERGDQNIYYRDNMPIWISDSEGGSWFYAKKMKKGDSVTLQLGYLVDEDMLDEMVMEFNFGAGRNDGVWRFIDMRSAAE